MVGDSSRLDVDAAMDEMEAERAHGKVTVTYREGRIVDVDLNKKYKWRAEKKKKGRAGRGLAGV